MKRYNLFLLLLFAVATFQLNSCSVKDNPIDEPTNNNPINAEPICPDANHPHWIDLGLPSGTQWRCCNEGASTPEGYGGYYTFDEARAYNPPSLDQIKELVDNCTSVWTTQNGVNGRKFTGPNGSSVFLPAAGNRWRGALDAVGSFGYYWSSTPRDEDLASILYFYSAYASWIFVYDRAYGQSVRPVR